VSGPIGLRAHRDRTQHSKRYQPEQSRRARTARFSMFHGARRFTFRSEKGYHELLGCAGIALQLERIRCARASVLRHFVRAGAAQVVHTRAKEHYVVAERVVARERWVLTVAALPRLGELERLAFATLVPDP